VVAAEERHSLVRRRGLARDLCHRHTGAAGDCGLLDMESGLGKAGRNSVAGIGLVGDIVVVGAGGDIGAGEEDTVTGYAEESRSSRLVHEGRGLVLGVEGIVVAGSGIADVGGEERNSVVAEEEEVHRRHSNLGLTL